MKDPRGTSPGLSQASFERGFTLLEFLIAFALLALMGTAMFSSFRLALNSYEKSQERLETKARQRVLEDLIRRQIGSLFPLAPTGAFMESEMEEEQLQVPGEGLIPGQAAAGLSSAPLFYGTNESMTFITLAPLHLLENPGLTVVRYGLAEDEWGRRYLGAMETRFNGIDSFQLMVEIPSGKPLEMVKGVSNLALEYYGYDSESQTFQWFEEWDGRVMLGVPSAVRILTEEKTIVATVNASVFGRNLRQGGLQQMMNARGRAAQALSQQGRQQGGQQGAQRGRQP